MGKGNKQVLNNNDEVALALKKNKGKFMIFELYYYKIQYIIIIGTLNKVYCVSKLRPET